MEILNLKSFKDKIFDYDNSKAWKFKGARPAIVDFYADWCGPCRILAPILDQVSASYPGVIDVYKIDTEASPELAALFGIRGIPSLLFIPMIGEPAMNSGVLQEDGFEKAIKELFGISKPEQGK